VSLCVRCVEYSIFIAHFNAKEWCEVLHRSFASADLSWSGIPSTERSPQIIVPGHGNYGGAEMLFHTLDLLDNFLNNDR